jgi:benzoyl-CoA reductase/2-hydroxyglutaryl-CoA dehydratase subunit BcrC/BadD/HgdB
MAFRTLVFGTELLRMSTTGYPEMVREYQVDGVVYNGCFTCPPCYISILEIMRVLEELGIPTAVIESDHVDERTFSLAQARTRLDALGERMLVQKGIRS